MNMTRVAMWLVCGIQLTGAGFLQAAPHWIWSADKNSAKPNEVVYFREVFRVGEDLESASLFGTCDNAMSVWINGQKVAESDEWQSPVQLDIRKFVVTGDNVVSIEAKNDSGTTAGLIMRIRLGFKGGSSTQIESSPDWRWSHQPEGGWMISGFYESAWSKSVSGGELGAAPWGELGSSSRPSRPGTGIDPENLIVAPGFQVERIYDVPRNAQGSWVSLTTGPDGSLFASDQGNQGIYQILVRDGSVQDVVRQKLDLSGAQGMVWAFNSLFVNLSGKGLFRAYDSNNDGVLDTSENLPSANGGGEHGNHAVILTEDGSGLYVVGGNHTNLPDFVKKGRMSMKWNEDLLLPRQWDARGHAQGVMAPGGWIARISPDSQDWEVVSVGYRNQYDIAINRHGEMFTYDADMEWDMGMPWYRPTRICHVTSGSEYGWRSGTGKWPVYYEDSLPPVVDIGPGSPTGVTMGTGARFPAKYQDALYALDWTFGTIYAIHLKPDGAGYSGVKEEFISGSPFPVTDAIVGADGAMYISIGGRGTQSALYRVTYVGTESTQPATGDGDPASARARRMRRQLESFHGKEDPSAIAQAWPYLSSQDRFLRYAARLALESQPAQLWNDRAFSEPSPRGRITALIAWARVGDSSDRDRALNSLIRINAAKLNESDQLALMRAYALVSIRHGKPDASHASRIISQLNTIDLGASRPLQTEWTRLGVYLDNPLVLEKALGFMLDGQPEQIPSWGQLIARNAGYGGTISQMLNNMPPTSRIQFALMLRNVRFGWTLDQRKQFFTFINEAAKHPGGASFPGFLENIRKEALENCSPAERQSLADLTGENLNRTLDFEVTPPKGPGRNWSVAAAANAMDSLSGNASFQNGRNLYHSAACAVCHLFSGEGGSIAPDLSSVRNKFSMNDLLESIVEPSKVISDQYGSVTVTDTSGKSVTGRALTKKDPTTNEAIVEIYTADYTAAPVRIPQSRVRTISETPISQMPPGLLNGLNASEVRDLMTYLMSRGNSEDPAYK